MARSQIWDGSEWVSMTGGSGDGGGSEPDDNYLRLDGANNNPSPNNYLRKVDADLLYLSINAPLDFLPIAGGTMTGRITWGTEIQSLAWNNVGGGSLVTDTRDVPEAGGDHLYFRASGDGTMRGITIGNYDEPAIILDRVLFTVKSGVPSYFGFGTNSVGAINLWDEVRIRGGIYATASGIRLFSDPGAPNQWEAHVTNAGFTILGLGLQKLNLGTNGFSVQHVYDKTTAAAHNMHITIGGTFQRSTAVAVAMAPGEDTALDARMGGASITDLSLEAVNFASVVNELLDRIEALEAFHP